MLARVLSQHGRHAWVIDEKGVHRHCVMKGRDLSPVANDEIVLDIRSDPAVIESICPRTNVVLRSEAHKSKTLAANIDQVVIVAASANPEPRHGFIDRCLAVAFDQNIVPIIIMTKSDLADPTEFLETYSSLDVITFATQRGADLSNIVAQLAKKTSVLIGHSGVGKSTLVNALLGEEHRATGNVNDATGRGRHTSSSAISFDLPQGGNIIDTPGVRSFGLEHVDKNRVIGSFPELQPGIALCPKNCSHDEEMCGLNDFISGRPELQRRVAGLRRLLAASSQPLM